MCLPIISMTELEFKPWADSNVPSKRYCIVFILIISFLLPTLQLLINIIHLLK